jgi:DNA-binding transcriptional MocR family regulator
MSAVDIVFDMVLDPGSTLLIEDFTFTAAIDAMKATRANLEQVQSDRGEYRPLGVPREYRPEGH